MSGGRQSGQASVEVVGVLPLVAVVLVVVLQLLAAGAARELADHAAEAGAVALLEHGDPAKAARQAVPSWARDRVHVRVRGRRVTVRLNPPGLPGIDELLAAEADAVAGARAA